MSKVNQYKRTSGFTLIELLVVIAIIGILSSVVLASLNGARESSRNARRQSDMSQIETAINLCANEKGDYANCGSGQLAPDYIQSFPDDPGGGSYNVQVSAGGYCISAPDYEATSSAGYPDNDTSCSSDYSIGPGT